MSPVPPRKSPPKNQPTALLSFLCAMIGQRIAPTTVTIARSARIVSVRLSLSHEARMVVCEWARRYFGFSLIPIMGRLLYSWSDVSLALLV